MEDDNFLEDKVRSPQEVALRALALFGVWGLAIGSPRDEVLGWLDDHNLRKELSPYELKYIDNQHPSPKQNINLSWHSERFIILLWALKLVENLPDADKQCDTRVFKRCLPPFAGQSVEQFITNAATRSEDELLNEAERTLDLHWQVRDARLNNRKPKVPVDIEAQIQLASA